MAIGTNIKSAIKQHLMGILIALSSIIGIMVGFTLIILKQDQYTSRERMYITFPGEILIQMLKAIAPSLMVGSLVTSVSNLDTYISPRIGGQLLVYILVTKFESVALGVGLALLIRPGHMDKVKPPRYKSPALATLLDNILDILRNMFPRSMIEMNFSTYETVLIPPINSTRNKYEWEIKEDGNMINRINMMGIISWSIMLGTALSVMHKGNLPLIYFFHCLTKISTIITVWVLWISPVMIICLLAGDIIGMKPYYSLLPHITPYLITVHCALLIQFLIVYPLIYLFFVRKNPFILYNQYWHALVTAFATSSSLASLPISIKRLIDNSQMDPRIVWFVIPVSHCMNMDGIAIVLGVATVFVAQADDVSLTTGNIIIIIILGAVASFVSASTSSSYMKCLFILMAGLKLPSKRLGMIIFVDWLIDRSVTVVNIMGDAIAVGVIESYNKTWLELEMSDTQLRNKEDKMYGNISTPNTSAADNATPRAVAPSDTVTPGGTVPLSQSATPRVSTRMKSAMPKRTRPTYETDNLKESDEL